MCANFQLKRTHLTFSSQICPKMKLRFEITKTNVGVRISIFEIPCVLIFRQNRKLWLFGPKFYVLMVLLLIFQLIPITMFCLNWKQKYQAEKEMMVQKMLKLEYHWNIYVIFGELLKMSFIKCEIDLILTWSYSNSDFL